MASQRFIPPLWFGEGIPRPLLTLPVVGLTVLLGSIFLWVMVNYVRLLIQRQKMPPGPFPWPVVGNFYHIPNSKQWIAFEKWADEYQSPIITLWNGRKPIIVLNDCWVASELLEKRAHIYSSRPHYVAMGDLLGSTKNNQTLLPYGDQWRLHRRIMHTVVGSQAVRSHRDIQVNESRLLMRDLLEKPRDYVDSIERYSCSVVSIIGWGRRITKTQDPVAQVATAILHGAKYGVPGLYLLEAIPILAKLPSWLYALPSQLRRAGQSGQNYFYELSKEGAEAPEDNFAKRLMREKDAHGLNPQEIGTLTANLIGGGVDTTTGSLLTFLFAMCLFKDKQATAQAEIDRVVGPDRYPDWSDQPNLPYTVALITEVMRWRSVFVLGGPPHCPIEDDVYENYLIPKGAVVIGNLWAIHRNPRDYPNPDQFRPERFLQGLERPHPTKKGINAFGWGRRACSGQPLAEQGLFLTVTEMLWAFDIEVGSDEKGNGVILDIFDFDDGQTSRPLPFPIRFHPRSDRHADYIKQQAAIADQALQNYNGETKVVPEA